MPKIKFEKVTSLSPKDAFEKIKTFFEDDRDLRKLDSSYQCQFNETSLSGTAKGSKFDAQMSVGSDPGGSRIELVVSLPMLLTPFKGFVEKTIQSKLDKLIT